jgi:hypothetical protein
MSALGIALIVIGIALVCAALILRPRRETEEDQAERGNVRPRLDEISDKNSSE